MVGKIEIYGLKINGEICRGTDLSKLIVEEAEKQTGGIAEGDIIVVTSKIVSKAEGRVYNLADVKPSRKAQRLSKLYKTPPEVMELYLKAGRIVAIIPVEKFARKFWVFFAEHAANAEEALRVIEEHPYLFLIDVNGKLLSWGGIDFSNAPPGHCTAPPVDPDESAKAIRSGVKRLTGKDVAVVIADTEWKLDKFGSVDIAIGCCGINPVKRGFGGRDLYGKPKFGGVDNLADLVSAAANMVLGQTGEATPVAIIRGLRYEKSEKGIKDITYSREVFRETLKAAVWEGVKFKLVSKLP
ncbi:MAG: coenzyme F420-0:L-glutamate ligase [Candidatus Bathyarchaeia archaeon]